MSLGHQYGFPEDSPRKGAPKDMTARRGQNPQQRSFSTGGRYLPAQSHLPGTGIQPKPYISDQSDRRDLHLPEPGLRLEPQLPSAMPIAPQPGPLLPVMPPSAQTPILPPTTAAPVVGEPPATVQSPYYTAGFLRNFLGRNMRVEFLIGTSGALVDRVGTLVEVGASYIVLRPLFANDLVMCDLYSIKFATIYS